MLDNAYAASFLVVNTLINLAEFVAILMVAHYTRQKNLGVYDTSDHINARLDHLLDITKNFHDQENERSKNGRAKSEKTPS